MLSAGYLLILGTAFIAAFVVPEIAGTNPAYVNDVIDVTNGGTSSGDIGAMVAVNRIRASPTWPAA